MLASAYYNPNIQETETGELPCVWGQSGLLSEFQAYHREPVLQKNWKFCELFSATKKLLSPYSLGFYVINTLYSCILFFQSSFYQRQAETQDKSEFSNVDKQSLKDNEEYGPPFRRKL